MFSQSHPSNAIRSEFFTLQVFGSCFSERPFYSSSLAHTRKDRERRRAMPISKDNEEEFARTANRFKQVKVPALRRSPVP
jgi:hypothetical protein